MDEIGSRLDYIFIFGSKSKNTPFPPPPTQFALSVLPLKMELYKKRNFCIKNSLTHILYIMLQSRLYFTPSTKTNYIFGQCTANHCNTHRKLS